jgi:hypothetical protein
MISAFDEEDRAVAEFTAARARGQRARIRCHITCDGLFEVCCEIWLNDSWWRADAGAAKEEAQPMKPKDFEFVSTRRASSCA